jgi:hypothetical protein
MPRTGLKEVESRCVGDELAAEWALVGKVLIDGGSVDVDCRDYVLYSDIPQAGLEQSPEPEQSFVDDDDEEEPSVSKSSFTFDRIA